MGLFSLFKKKPAAEQSEPTNSTPPLKVEMSFGGVTDIVPADIRCEKCKPSANGLYPHEILILSYAESFMEKERTYQQFWHYKYGVENVSAILKNLKTRGFIKRGSSADALALEKLPVLKEMLSSRGIKTTGKKADLIARIIENVSTDELNAEFPNRPYALTDLGKAELEENEYVRYVHDRNYHGIDIFNVNMAIGEGSPKRYRDAIWGQFNEMTLNAMGAADYFEMASARSCMASFLMEEERYKDAVMMWLEVSYSDLNSNASRTAKLGKEAKRFILEGCFPYSKNSTAVVRPGAVKELKKCQDALNMSDMEFVEFIGSISDRLSDYPVELFNKDELVKIVELEMKENVSELEKIYEAAESRFRKTYK